MNDFCKNCGYVREKCDCILTNRCKKCRLLKCKCSANVPEPEPIKNDSTPIWDLVIEDMKQRNEEGIKKYGTPLQANNGRKALVDAYQEILDLAVYLRQEIEERNQKEKAELLNFKRQGNALFGNIHWYGTLNGVPCLLVTSELYPSVIWIFKENIWSIFRRFDILNDALSFIQQNSNS